MKNNVKMYVGIALVTVLLTSARAVFADSGNYVEQAQGQGQGQGRGVGSEQDGLLDDYMTTAMADVFGLTVEELELRLETEESFITIALSQGFSIEEVDELMDTVHTIAVEIAAADGVILGRQEANQMFNQSGAKGHGGRIAGRDEAPRINMTEGECDETCDGNGEHLYENSNGESMMRRGGRR
jgi:hypothetical protein